MTHDELEQADHGGIEPLGSLVAAGAATPSAVGSPFVPMAEEIPSTGESPAAFIPNPEGTGGSVGLQIPQIPIGWPGHQLPHSCNINLPSGCYRISFQPTSSMAVFYGTMRV